MSDTKPLTPAETCPECGCGRVCDKPDTVCFDDFHIFSATDICPDCGGPRGDEPEFCDGQDGFHEGYECPIHGIIWESDECPRC